MKKELKLKARPLNLLEEQSYSLVHFFLMRISPFLSFFLARYSKIQPNYISIISILFLILSFFFLHSKNYIIAFMFLLLNFFTDNVDGELARIKNQVSDLGEKLEKINSNLFYLFFFNIISLNLYIDNLIDINLFQSFIFISILHYFFRGRISHIKIKDKLELNYINSTYLGLFKYSSTVRNQYIHSKIIYIFFYNILFSGGVSEIIIICLLYL